MKKFLSLFLAFCLLPMIALADLQVYFLDIGQGDAAVLLCDGESMMIDGGPSSASQFIYSFLRNTLQLDHLDYMIATHPHKDHIGGLAAALNAVPVDLILSPVLVWDTKAFSSLLKYANEQGAPIVIPNEGDTLQLGGATVTVLHCWPEAWDENDMSIVVRVDYGETSFLFTGDAGEMSELMMLDSDFPLHVDVLKVGHHGSRTASCQEFIEAVSPTYAIISCVKDNQYGHPHEETLETLSGIDVLRTDLMGTIICSSDGFSLHIQDDNS